MKRIGIYIVFAISLILSGNGYSQVINWESLEKDQRHIINANAGVEYGLTVGAGYSYHLKTVIPVILNAEYSMPSGKKLTDDFKTKIGGQLRVYEINDFQFSARIQGVFRRYENSYSRLLNFGSDMAGVIGYYKPKWFVAGEAGFDKAIVTHFKHSTSYKENFPGVQDGWYDPSTGGNFYYGLQTGFSFGRNDFYVKGGRMVTQDFSTTPLFPYYLQVGFNIKFK